MWKKKSRQGFPEKKRYVPDPFSVRPFWGGGGGELTLKVVYLLNFDQKLTVESMNGLPEATRISGGPTKEEAMESDEEGWW